ncbi:MAG: hypothetical protein ACKOAS_08130 [Verrucomicrobiota bacterium]
MPIKNSIWLWTRKIVRRSQTAATSLVSIAACIFSAATLGAAPRETLFDLRLDRALELKGLAIPLEDSSGERVGRLQVERVSLESAQFGFLRIGVLPRWVLQGVRIIPGAEGDCRWIGAFHAFLRRETSLANARIEDFQILTTAGQSLLTARSGGFSQDLGKIFLEKVLIEFLERGKIHIRQAEIRLNGRDAGQLLGVVPSGRDFNLCFPSYPP